MGTVAACRLLGIGRKTGYRWRAENGGLSPARLAESARSGRYPSLLERHRIATLRDRGIGVREIARRLAPSASTISRELRRHLRPHDRGIYDGDLAHARARERLRRPRRPVLAREPELRQIVQDKLKQAWSPAQIAAHLRETYPGRPAWHLCPETIHQAPYHGGKGGLSRTLTKKLRTRRPLRKRRRMIVERGRTRGTRLHRPCRACVRCQAPAGTSVTTGVTQGAGSRRRHMVLPTSAHPSPVSKGRYDAVVPRPFG